MTAKTTTSAHQISALLGDDGSTWRTADGRDLDDLCREAGAGVERRDDQTRYSWPDGSAIVAAPGGWDLAYPRCWCWHGAGHMDNCPETGTCSLPGCERESYAAPKQGALRRLPLCEAHYRRAIRGSTSTAPARTRGREGLVALSLRLPQSVRDALGPSPASRAREVLTAWARART